MNSQIQEIKERLPITEVLADYIQMRKAGVNFKAVCPFHNEKTPSLIVSPAKQIWHCFGCGLGGDIIKFVELAENMEFREALKILADRAGVELRKPTAAEVKIEKTRADLYEINEQAAKYYVRVLWESESAKPALEYLRKRGLTDRTIQTWQLGYAPDDFHYLENFLSKSYGKKDIEQAGLIIKKDQHTHPSSLGAQPYFDRFRGRIMFPIHNIHGQVVGFTGRLLVEKENTGKYINSPETPIYNKSRERYGFYQAKNAIRKQNRCIVVEGNMDVIASHQAGFTETIASSGTALTDYQLAQLKRFGCENIIFAFDNDTAGSIATRRALELALNQGFNVKIANLGTAKDPDELIKEGIGLWKKSVEGAVNFVEFFFDKTFAEHDPTSVEGKREIVKLLAPLIFRITEPVTKAHFVRKLATGVNIAESSIWDIISKLTLPKPYGAIRREETRAKKSRREILEDQVVGLSLLLGDNSFLTDLGLPVPDEADQQELLKFSAETDLSEENLDPKSELPKLAGELRKLMLKTKMEQVANDLAVAEKSKDKEKTQELSAEFSKLTKEFRNLGI